MNPLVQPDPGLFIWTIVTFLGLLWALKKLASAALNDALVVSIPFVLKIGPLPDVFGCGSFTPFFAMHAANFANRCAPPAAKPLPPRN